MDSSTNLNTFRPGTAGVARTEVELSISGRNLLDLDTFSKSDPMCVVYSKNHGQGGHIWKEIGRTECINNNLNPKFATKINLHYTFEQQQLMRFEVYDIDSDSSDLRDHDFIGLAECSLGRIVAAGGGGSSSGLELRLKNSNNRKVDCGDLIVQCEEMNECREEIQIKLGVNLNLPKQSFYLPTTFSFLIVLAFVVVLISLYLGIVILIVALFVKLLSKESGTFLTISRANEGSDKHENMNVVYRTETNPMEYGKITWKAIHLPVKTLCNGNRQRPIKIECFQYRRSGSHVLLGEIVTTTEMLQQNTKMRSKNHTYSKLMSPTCELEVFSCDIQKTYSFLDYIKGGTELACTVAIDFTASNGDPFNPDSLHYITPIGKSNNEFCSIYGKNK